ncbi:MAG TPA: zinc-ribbon domain-containing protein [Archangium sp.]|uniref:zinc-ribbon domain-containing protein n=1 Tax=Archangium sp. TaxID=1872627 RepID=UPI002EDB5194
MIVKCERCQTRFKIPDEKVTDKGVKVRCTKCQHTFRVVREDASSATSTPAGPSVPSVEPAAKPAAPPRSGTPLEAPRASAPVARPVAATAPGVAFPRGGTAPVPTSLPRVGGGMDVPKTPGTLDLDPLMEFMGENTPSPAESLQLAAKAPLPDKPAGALAFGPQAKTTAPASPAAGPSLSLSFDESNPFAEAAPAPRPVPARSPAPAPKPAAPVQVPARSTAPAPAPKPAPAPVPSRSSAPVSFDADDPFNLPPDDAATLRATPTLPPAQHAAPAPAPAFEEMEGLEGNNPFVSFDPVAALPPAPSPAPAPSAIPDWGAPQQAAPSAIPDWGATQTVAATPIAKSDAQTERNPFPIPDFPGGAPPTREILPDLPAMTPTSAAPVIAAPAEPAKKPREDSAGGPRPVQRLAAVAAQVVVAAVLVLGLLALGTAWLNGGRVELSALSPSKMRELVSPTLPLMGKDLSNGLYETHDGRTLFFVRGEVENRGTDPVRVKALVSLYDGAQRVKSAEGLVGTVPSSEELFTLKNAAAADALRTRLDAAAQEVAPGARAPFVVLFYDYPSDLGSFRLEVTFEPQARVAAGGTQEKAGNAQP